MLELLAQFQRGRRQRDEPRERGAPIGIEADVMIERALAPWRGRAGEVERPQARGGDRSAHDFHHVGVGALVVMADLGGKRSDIDAGIGERRDGGRNVGGCERRQVALHVDHDIIAAFRVDRLQGLEDAVGAGRVIGAGHDGAAACLLHRGGDRLRIGCDHHRADPGSLRPAHDMDDHRLARDVHKRLAGEPRGGHAGRNEDEGHRQFSGRPVADLA